MLCQTGTDNFLERPSKRHELELTFRLNMQKCSKSLKAYLLANKKDTRKKIDAYLEHDSGNLSALHILTYLLLMLRFLQSRYNDLCADKNYKHASSEVVKKIDSKSRNLNTYLISYYDRHHSHNIFFYMSGVNWGHVCGQLRPRLWSIEPMLGVNWVHIWYRLWSCLGSNGVMS